jgi:hypothetical protein
MNRIAIRGLCLFALLASVAIRIQANGAREAMTAEFDASAAVAAVVRDHGYQLRENPVKPPMVLSVVVYFQRPECARASLVLPYFINAEIAPLLSRVTDPGFDRHFYYMDGVWDEQSRVSMFLQWAKYAMLDIFGASPYVPVKKALVLADPSDCHPAVVIDWRPVWEKDRSRHIARPHGFGASEHVGT